MRAALLFFLAAACFAETIQSVGTAKDPNQWVEIAGGTTSSPACTACHADKKSFIVPTKPHSEGSPYVQPDHPHVGPIAWFFQALRPAHPVKRAWLHFHGYNEVSITVLHCTDDWHCAGAAIPGKFHGADLDIAEHLKVGVLNLIQLDVKRGDGIPAVAYKLNPEY